MLRRPAAIVVAAAALALTGTAAVVGFSSSFQGAPAGVSLAFEFVELPPVKPLQLAASPASSTLQAVVGLLDPAATNAWQPPLAQLVNGNTVITTEAEMRDVWARLFRKPFDASLFDFESDFVVLMGGGLQVTASFSVSAVERVEAEYSTPLVPPPGGNEFDAFVSVTGTLVIPGAFPSEPPPAKYIVSAVRVSKDHLDDVAFHRNLIALP